MGTAIFRTMFGIFSKKSNTVNDEKKLSLIRYKIARGNIDDALSDVQQLTLKGISIPEPYLLEAKMYCENFDHEMKAVRLIEVYFENPRLEVHSGNVELLELYTRICADFHQQGKALSFLKHELSKPGYTIDDRAKLQVCLDDISPHDDENDGIVVKSHPAEASRNLHSLSNRTVMLSAEDLK